MSPFVSKSFWFDLVDRVIRTFAQTLVALWGAGTFNLLQVDWVQTFGVAGGAALIAALMAFATPGQTAPDSPIGRHSKPE